jgi:hypothetical protein
MKAARTVWIALVSAIMLGCGGEAEPDSMAREETVTPEAIKLEAVGLMTPESVLHDEEADVYLVSNVNGAPLDEDGNGFIARVAPTGDVIDLKWIDGAADGVTLNAPKGMAIVGDTLYVADITSVRMFDRNEGTPIADIPVVGSDFLNDLYPGPDGEVYVTDSGMTAGEGGFVPTGNDAVYTIRDRTVEMLASGELDRPNGVHMADGTLWVASFGSNSLYSVGNDGKEDEVLLPTGGLDGLIVTEDGQFLVSSWEGKSVYRGTPDGGFVVIVSDLESPADIGYDERRGHLLVPLFMKDEVQIIPLDETR